MTRRRLRRSWRPFEVLALAGFAAVRLWLAHGRDWGYWQDSATYVRAAAHPFWSTAFWAGDRAPGLPLVLKLTGPDFLATVHLQIWVSIVAWALLAFAASRLVAAGWPRTLALVGVLAFAATKPITLWDRQILTESLSLSMFALALAAALWCLRRPTWPRVGALVAASTAWATLRDDHGLVVGLLGFIVLVALGVRAARGRRPIRRPVAQRLGALGAALVIVFGAAQLSADHGDRLMLPLADVFAVRILPFPDRFAWFADRGMPQTKELHARVVAASAGDPDLVVVNAYGPDQPGLARYYRWLAGAGQQRFVEWLVLHPGYLVGEPFRSPSRTFNEPGRYAFYAGDVRTVPGLAVVLFPPWWALAGLGVLAALGLGVALRRRRLARWPAAAVATSGVLTLVHAVTAWHGGAQEPTRHLLLTDVQARVTVLLALVLVADAIRRHPGGRRGGGGAGVGEGGIAGNDGSQPAAGRPRWFRSGGPGAAPAVPGEGAARLRSRRAERGADAAPDAPTTAPSWSTGSGPAAGHEAHRGRPGRSRRSSR